MKKIPFLTATFVALALLAPVAAWAAKAEGAKLTKPKLVEKYDANKNGKLDGDEVAQLKSDFLADPKGDLKRLDADHDGKLSDAELTTLTGDKRAKAAEKKPGGRKKKDL